MIVNLVFSHLDFWSGNLFLIAPFPDLCLLVPFSPLPKHVIPTLCSKYFDSGARSGVGGWGAWSVIECFPFPMFLCNPIYNTVQCFPDDTALKIN